jgi:hypothetical protein
MYIVNIYSMTAVCNGKLRAQVSEGWESGFDECWLEVPPGRPTAHGHVPGVYFFLGR